MQFTFGHLLTALALLALAISGVTLADDDTKPSTTSTQRTYDEDPPAATCSQFEQLFPKAINHAKQSYYTLSINGSSAVFFYNERKEIAIGFILTQARRNAAKLAELLNLQYDSERTERRSRFHHAILFNRTIAYQVSAQQSFTTNDELHPPFHITNLLALLIHQNNYLFCGWNRDGIAFLPKERHPAIGLGFWASRVVFSAHHAQAPIVHFHNPMLPGRIVNYYPPLNNATRNPSPRARETKKILRASGLERMTHLLDKENIACGFNKDGTLALGKVSSHTPISDIPSCAPKSFPKQRSEWPTASLATLQKEEDKLDEKQKEIPVNTSEAKQKAVPIPQQEPQQKAIHMPLTPQEALDAYLKHLQSF